MAPLRPAFPSFQSQRFFGSLDGLRALSIAAVIWHHAASEFFPAWVPLVHSGNRGVNLFFVISAFLISTLLIRGKRSGGLHIPRFWCRRALRILPLYYAMLLVYVAAVVFTERDAVARSGFFAHLPYFASFTSNWFVPLDGRVIFYFAWSLAAEEQFYLCWPWIERAFTGAHAALLALGGLVVSQVAGQVWNATHALFLLKIVSSVPAAILLGVVLAHVLDSPRGFRAVSAIAGRRGAGVLALGGVVAVLALEPWLGAFGEVAVALSLAALVATCVVREDNDLAPVLGWRPIAWIGTISYGIYLMHPLCIAVGRALLGRAGVHRPVPLFLVALALSVVVASLSFVTFERFFLRLKDRVFAGPAKAGAAFAGGAIAIAAIPAVVTPIDPSAVSRGPILGA